MTASQAQHVSGLIGNNVRKSYQWLEISPPNGLISYHWIEILLLAGYLTTGLKSYRLEILLLVGNPPFSELTE